jgi:hypothetical protein
MIRNNATDSIESLEEDVVPRASVRFYESHSTRSS